MLRIFHEYLHTCTQRKERERERDDDDIFDDIVERGSISDIKARDMPFIFISKAKKDSLWIVLFLFPFMEEEK